MRIVWSDDLRTAISEIDEQHQELFHRINALLDACEKGHGKEEIGRVIGFLQDYVVTHFETEEQHMTATDYPAYAGHKEEHEYFTAQIGDLKRKFIQEGKGIGVITLTLQTLATWLSNHIRRTDRAMAEYLKQQKSVNARKAFGVSPSSSR